MMWGLRWGGLGGEWCSQIGRQATPGVTHSSAAAGQLAGAGDGTHTWRPSASAGGRVAPCTSRADHSPEPQQCQIFSKAVWWGAERGPDRHLLSCLPDNLRRRTNHHTPGTGAPAQVIGWVWGKVPPHAREGGPDCAFSMRICVRFLFNNKIRLTVTHRGLSLP